MAWLVPNLWLIPALAAALGAIAQAAGAERREKVAHGVSRGIAAEKRTSPGGASENKSHFVTFVWFACSFKSFAPPGLIAFGDAVPRLTPWATVYRRYAAVPWQRLSARE